MPPRATAASPACPAATRAISSTSCHPRGAQLRAPDAPYVLQPAVAAGDVLIFTEALVHGTMPWTAEHERRALLYKYSPGHSAWDRDGYDLADYRSFHLTERRRRIMQPPHVGGHQPVLDSA